MLGTIRWKIILYSVVPVMLVYNLIFCIYFYLTFEDIKSDVKARTTNDLRVIARSIGAELDSLRIFTNIFANDNQTFIKKLLVEDRDQLVLPSLLEHPLIHGVFVYERNVATGDFDGKGYCLEDPEGVSAWEGRVTPSDFPQLYHALSSDPDKGLWTQLRHYNDTPQMVVSYVHPLPSGKKPTRYFSIDVDIHQLMKKVLNQHLLGGKYLQSELLPFNLVDQQGAFLYKGEQHNDGKTGERLARSDFIRNFGHPLQALINKGEPTSHIVPPSLNHGDEMWFFGAPVKTVEWWLYTKVSRHKALDIGYHAIVVNAMILIISLLLITLCSWYASVKITQPILLLKKSMDFFTYKNKKPVLIINTQDEISSLAESFLQLTEKLSDREQALHEARANNIGNLLQKLGGSYFYFNLDFDGCVSHVSSSIETVLGYKAATFHCPFVDYVMGDDNKHQFLGQLERALQYGKSDTFELDMRHKEGSHRRIEVFWSHAANYANNCPVIEGLANDITERVSDTERFKNLLDAGPDATVITTMDGIISLVNSKAEYLFGFQRSELVNMPLCILSPMAHRKENPLLYDLQALTWEELCLDAFESYGINSQGKQFPTEVTSNPLETEQGLLVSIVIRDISARKAIEEELVFAKETAERASQAKGMFLSNMSHELRTPLNGVLGYAQVLLRDGDMPERHRNSLKAIESSGHHLLALINDILDLTKIESGEIELHNQPCRLKTMIDDVDNIMCERTHRKGLSLQFDIAPDIPDVVILDEIKIRQVLLNLVSNAVKFTLKGKVVLSLNYSQHRLMFMISDTGIGISDHDLRRIFEPFRQLNPHLEVGGTGLGLAISRWLVDCMGGELSVDSTVGKGSVFSFDVPVELVEANESAPEPSLLGEFRLALSAHEQSLPLLVVDDIASNRDMMDCLLTGAGFEVVMAGNGLEAVGKIASGRYELVLMDIKMPVMNGIEAVHNIRAMDNAMSSVPIIAVTASISEETQSKLLEEGFDGYISKPFDARVLFDLMGKLLGKTLIQPQVTQPQTINVSNLSLDERQRTMLHALLVESLELGDMELLKEGLSVMNDSLNVATIIAHVECLCDDMDIEGLELLTQQLQNL